MHFPDFAEAEQTSGETMPTVAIEVRREYTAEQEIEIIDAVHAAMIECLKIPLGNLNTRLIAHKPHRFTAPGKTDRFTIVSIDLFQGRSLATKRALYRAIVRNLGQLGIPADHIKTVLREHKRENWGVRGGVPASDVDLGYEVHI